jgi:hypothetical protein
MSVLKNNAFNKKSITTIEQNVYCHLSGICVTKKTGFGFDDKIYWTFIQLATTVQKTVYDTLSSSSGWTQLLLVLASAVILRFGSNETRNSILLSQIRGFPFHHLLRTVNYCSLPVI